MVKISEQQIQGIVDEVVRELAGTGAAKPVETSPAPAEGEGVFDTVDEAVAASGKAFQALHRLKLETRRDIIQAIRDVGIKQAREFSGRILAETGMGRLEDKVQKHLAVSRLTPGMEVIEQKAWSGDYGLTVDERAPYGVIAAVQPSTHPVPTMINNAISMVSAGNSVVFAPHPAARRVSAYATGMLNRAIVAAGGPPNLLTTIREPSIAAAGELFKHPDVRLICVTGGPGVVAAAMKSNKRVIAAGPGNPPVVVDQTADMDHAARSIIAGGAFDNNIICIAEKEIIVVEKCAGELIAALEKAGAVRLDTQQIERLSQEAFCPEDDGAGCSRPVLNRKLVGKNANVLGKICGLELSDEVRLLFGECEADSPFVREEQMMPFIPIVRAKDIGAVIELAVEVERGFKHTAVMHSRDVGNLTAMGRACDTTIFVKNGPSSAGLGIGGEGLLSFSIASPTGDGITTALTFTRQRRCTMVGYLNIVP
ncbi:MAG: aldehyde dehydrogenase family protein [Gemmatimonadota bacterium]|nr:aldehyde dehydrogenase family protein [Gemmatimonadota bacterium]